MWKECVKKMIVGKAIIRLYAPWARSLKDKRMVVKSLIDKTKNRFNVSVSEVDDMDNHKIIVIGLSCISNSASHVNSILDKAINYIETNTEAVMENVTIELL